MYVPYFTSQDNPKGLSRLKGRGHGLHLLIEGRASKAVEGHRLERIVLATYRL